MIPRSANGPEVTAAFECVARHLRDGNPPLEALSSLEMRCLKAIRLRQMSRSRFLRQGAALRELYESLPEAR